jgi:carbohydrate-binding DOMON domain-containing protein
MEKNLYYVIHFMLRFFVMSDGSSRSSYLVLVVLVLAVLAGYMAYQLYISGGFVGGAGSARETVTVTETMPVTSTITRSYTLTTTETKTTIRLVTPTVTVLDTITTTTTHVLKKHFSTDAHPVFKVFRNETIVLNATGG